MGKPKGRILAATLIAGVQLAAGALPASAACAGGMPNLNMRWYDGTHCGGGYHAAFSNDFVSNMASWGFNDKASSLYIDAEIVKVRWWVDKDCAGANIAVSGVAADAAWDTITYSNQLSSYKVWSTGSDGFPAAPAACVNAT